MSPENLLLQRYITQEQKYNMEFTKLLHILRSSIHKLDPMPIFNRRHLILIVTRLKQYSDQVLEDLKKTNDSTYKFLEILNTNFNSKFAMAYVAYVEVIDEVGDLLRRIFGSDVTNVYSKHFGCEKSIVPIHRLVCLKNTLKEILETNLDENIRLSLDNITGILDRCYEVLTSMQGHKYVSKLESVINYSLKLHSICDDKCDELKEIRWLKVVNCSGKKSLKKS